MLLYDKPFEVTQKQYNLLRVEFAGIVAHRKTNDSRFLIKVWSDKYLPLIEKVLISVK